MNFSLRISSDPADVSCILDVLSASGLSNDRIPKMREYLLDELVGLGDSRILFVLSNSSGDSVGVVQLVLSGADNDPALADGESIAHIHALQIARPYRKQGLAKRMMRELESYAKSKNISTLTLGVDDNNEVAIGLYKKLGYHLLKEAPGRTAGSKLFYLYKNI